MNKNKTIRIIILLFLAVFLSYHSVYFKKLSEVKSGIAAKFNAPAFAKDLWDNKMPAKIDSAVFLPLLMQVVSDSPDKAFDEYTHALAIGNYRYALVKLSGVVKAVADDECLVETPVADSLLLVKIATEFVFGNALRDASELVTLDDFPVSDDLNGISESLNQIVRSTVIPPFKQAVKSGDKVSVTGAIEINKEHIHWREAEIIPVRLQIYN